MNIKGFNEIKKGYRNKVSVTLFEKLTQMSDSELIKYADFKPERLSHTEKDENTISIIDRGVDTSDGMIDASVYYTTLDFEERPWE